VELDFMGGGDGFWRATVTEEMGVEIVREG